MGFAFYKHKWKTCDFKKGQQTPDKGVYLEHSIICQCDVVNITERLSTTGSI